MQQHDRAARRWLLRPWEWIPSLKLRFSRRGFSAGIYTTSSAEAVHYVLADSEANVAVVEDDAQLQKVLAVRARLPHLRAIVQYSGALSQRYSHVYTVRAAGPGQSRAERGGAGQGRAGQGRAGQGRAGQGRAGQGRAGQGRNAVY